MGVLILPVTVTVLMAIAIFDAWRGDGSLAARVVPIVPIAVASRLVVFMTDAGRGVQLRTLSLGIVLVLLLVLAYRLFRRPTTAMLEAWILALAGALILPAWTLDFESSGIRWSTESAIWTIACVLTVIACFPSVRQRRRRSLDPSSDKL